MKKYEILSLHNLVQGFKVGYLKMNYIRYRIQKNNNNKII